MPEKNIDLFSDLSATHSAEKSQANAAGDFWMVNISKSAIRREKSAAISSFGLFVICTETSTIRIERS